MVHFQRFFPLSFDEFLDYPVDAPQLLSPPFEVRGVFCLFFLAIIHLLMLIFDEDLDSLIGVLFGPCPCRWGTLQAGRSEVMG